MYNTKYGKQAKAIRDLADEINIEPPCQCSTCKKRLVDLQAKLRLLAEQLEQSR
jgi:hypothetical protein